MQRVGKYTLQLDPEPCLLAGGTIVGKKEREGPLGECFDASHDDSTLGQDTFEQAESKLQTEAAKTALQKAGVPIDQVQFILAGDLENQCTASIFGLRELSAPYLGLYGACSTMALSLGLAGLLVSAGAAEHVLAVTSSHFCAAERQFRFPLEYGGQRTPTAQWTATAAGAALVGRGPGKVHLRELCFGRMADLGVSDANNMGAAMAPAAVQTLADFFADTQSTPQDYDLVLTGDLGAVGSSLLRDLLARAGWDLGERHQDCGLLLYDREQQDVHAGGSGCGCSASVLCGYILPQLQRGELHDVLFVATGALMSPTSAQQGETIPGIAHLVHLQA